MANGEGRRNGVFTEKSLLPLSLVVLLLGTAVGASVKVTRLEAHIERCEEKIEELESRLRHHVEVDAKLMDARQRDIEINLKAQKLWKE